MKSLTGAEANILAILILHLGNKQIESEALDRLDGIALKIAKRIINPKYRCNKEVRATVENLIEWKNSLGH